MPKLYLSNWASHNTPGAHGPGRKWTIMARPRRWEVGEGSVPMLLPRPDDVLAVQEGALSMEAYRAEYVRLLAFRMGNKTGSIYPGHLKADTPLDPVLVADGDTLLCCCSAAKATVAECHRTWAATYLHLSGWDVILDGRPYTPENPESLLREWARV